MANEKRDTERAEALQGALMGESGRGISASLRKLREAYTGAGKWDFFDMPAGYALAVEALRQARGDFGPYRVGYAFGRAYQAICEELPLNCWREPALEALENLAFATNYGRDGKSRQATEGGPRAL